MLTDRQMDGHTAWNCLSNQAKNERVVTSISLDHPGKAPGKTPHILYIYLPFQFDILNILFGYVFICRPMYSPTSLYLYTGVFLLVVFTDTICTWGRVNILKYTIIILWFTIYFMNVDCYGKNKIWNYTNCVLNTPVGYNHIHYYSSFG